MPIHKVTDFLSEISYFFKKDDASNAIYTIMDVIKGVEMTEKTLFGITSQGNQNKNKFRYFSMRVLIGCKLI